MTTPSEWASKRSVIDRLGKRTLDLVAGTITLENRTNNTTYKLDPESLERWKRYMFGNTRQGGGGKDQFVRLSGVFPTAKGNLIGRISIDAFDTVYKMMQSAAQIGGTLNLIIAKNKNTGKPEMYAVVGQPYQKEAQPAQQEPSGPFGQFTQQRATPAPPAGSPQAPSAGQASVPFAAPAREVQFGQVDVPKDDFDSLLESLNQK